jgi:hypothetical protein
MRILKSEIKDLHEDPEPGPPAPVLASAQLPPATPQPAVQQPGWLPADVGVPVAGQPAGHHTPQA